MRTSDILVIAPNFKRRLSGVTSTIIQLVPLQAKSLPVDALILDLEDAVAAADKETARDAAVEAVAALPSDTDTLVLIRVNGPTTPMPMHTKEAAVASDLVTIDVLKAGSEMRWSTNQAARASTPPASPAATVRTAVCPADSSSEW